MADLCSIDQSMIVADESELSESIKELNDQETVLIAKIPSSDSEALDGDNMLEKEQCLIFVLQKVDFKSMTSIERTIVRIYTQAMMTSVKVHMKALALDTDHNNEYTVLMRRLDLNGMHTDPEYDYMGCTGWSLSFLLKSKNLNYQIP